MDLENESCSTTPAQECQSQKLVKIEKMSYKEKNLELLEKIKEKKLRQIEEKEQEERRQLALKQKLRKKVLDEAQRIRETKEKENNQIDIVKIEGSVKNSHKERRPQCESLPKVNTNAEKQEVDKQKYKNRYLQFLTNLTDGLKEKKEKEEAEKRKKEQKYHKLKEELGVTKVQSKIGKLLDKPQLHQSQSAQKMVPSDIQIQEQQLMPKSNKYFQEKHNEYLQKIKKKRELELQQKEEHEKRIELRKEKLKEFVMTTVKRNVLDGMYDDQLEKKKKINKPKQKTGGGEGEFEEKNEGHESSEESESEGGEAEQQKKKRRKMRSFPYVTDLTEWKKKNRLTPETKVFIVTGGYIDVKKALYNRGWVQNPDYNSPCFDLKWTLQGKELDYPNLLQNQVVNHFEKNGAITTKIGLCKNIRNMVWINNMDVDQFYPKCFDLNDQDDYAYFEEYFKICKAQSILILYLKLFNAKETAELEKIRLRAKVALDVCQRNIMDIDDIIDKKKNPLMVTAKQWEVLAVDELNNQGLAKKKHEQWLQSIDMKYNDKKIEKVAKKKKKVKKEKVVEQESSSKIIKEEKNQFEEIDSFTKDVTQLLELYEEKFPQYTLTDIYNTWILKPAGLSRGRGITCYNNLVEIQDHIKSKQSLWVAQKYIQNPLIVCKRKFDIRQWVLVTDFNPLIIWFYEECYIRFSVLDYNAEQVNNKFIHLTNNSIGALHKNFDKSEIKGNMFSMDQFREYLIKKEGNDIFNEKIKPQMKDIVKWSLESAQEHIENRKNSHEMFGYDFMIDDNYKVWLIEINSSPSMDYSTHVTTRLVKEGLEDTVKVIVDYNTAPKKIRKTVDTGKYKLLFKGKQIPEKPITTGLNLGIEGIAMKKNSKRMSVKPTTLIMQNSTKEDKKVIVKNSD